MGFTLLDPRALDRDLVFEFFWKFSVFECALKRTGADFYLKSKTRGDAAEANWEAFGAAIDSRFAKLSTPAFCEAVTRIRKLSPRKQVNNAGKLGWRPVVQQSSESDAAYTLRLLKTVRNNLFHGGKYPDGHEFEIARDREILRAALAVLDGCYELDPRVKAAIEGVVADAAA